MVCGAVNINLMDSRRHIVNGKGAIGSGVGRVLLIIKRNSRGYVERRLVRIFKSAFNDGCRCGLHRTNQNSKDPIATMKNQHVRLRSL